jgi:6-phosphofructokinase 1
VPKRNAIYAQSGGVTAVINATACGVIEAARRHHRKIGKVYAGRDGILGVLTENLIDTTRETPAAIRALRHTPGGAFGSCRYKLKGLEENRAQYERLLAVFDAHDIGYFFYNGGNDSADTALKIAQLSKALGYPLHCIGIPKTVDNDLEVTDNCPGFGSVAKYVATSMLETGYDVASMARTSTKVFVLEVMGRNAGWITAACGLAAQHGGDSPHILLLPEIAFDPERFLERVDAVVKEHGFCTIAVSEGLRGADGKLMIESGLRDAFGHAQLGGVAPIISGLVRKRYGYRCHWAVADYLQRSARHLASKTDLEQAYAVGKSAVELAVAGETAVMPVIVRKSHRPYRWTIGVAPLDEIANREKKVPRDFVTDDGFHITAKCRRYLLPLIQGEAPPPYKNGLPAYCRLKNRPVRKLLNVEFTP